MDDDALARKAGANPGTVETRDDHAALEPERADAEFLDGDGHAIVPMCSKRSGRSRCAGCWRRDAALRTDVLGTVSNCRAIVTGSAREPTRIYPGPSAGSTGTWPSPHPREAENQENK